VSLKIPPETQGGRTFRLKEQGMPLLRDSNKRGDLYAKVKVVLPKNLSPKEKELFRDLAQIRGKGHS
jgi:DnaJ-class molecular chaperone